MPKIAGLAQISLTVRRLERSASWYCSVFGLDEVGRSRHKSFDLVELRDPESGMMIVLRQVSVPSTARFDPNKTGLHHLSFRVLDREALEAWASRLEELHIMHSPVVQNAHGWVLELEDPDHIKLELVYVEPKAFLEPEGEQLELGRRLAAEKAAAAGSVP